MESIDILDVINQKGGFSQKWSLWFKGVNATDFDAIDRFCDEGKFEKECENLKKQGGKFSGLDHITKAYVRFMRKKFDWLSKTFKSNLDQLSFLMENNYQYADPKELDIYGNLGPEWGDSGTSCRKYGSPLYRFLCTIELKLQVGAPMEEMLKKLEKLKDKKAKINRKIYRHLKKILMLGIESKKLIDKFLLENAKYLDFAINDEQILFKIDINLMKNLMTFFDAYIDSVLKMLDQQASLSAKNQKQTKEISEKYFAPEKSNMNASMNVNTNQKMFTSLVNGRHVQPQGSQGSQIGQSLFRIWN